jgi:hypothetical protein
MNQIIYDEKMIRKIREEMIESELLIFCIAHNWENSSIFCIHLSQAIFLNKPILILSPQGFVLPDKLIKISSYIRVFDHKAENIIEEIKQKTDEMLNEFQNAKTFVCQQELQ